MSYTIPGNRLYQIDDDYNVTRVDGRDLPLEEKDGKIPVPLYGYVKTVDKEWLYWLAYFKLELEKGYEYAVWEYVFKRHGLIYVHSKDPMIVVFKNPVTVIGDKGLRIIPRFPNYAISEKGDLLKISTKRYIAYNKDKYIGNTYPRISVVDQVSNQSYGQPLHRLVAMAWVKNDDFITKPIVDHIDANKTNCHASNLQWISYRDNIAKAVGFCNMDKSLKILGDRFKARNIPKRGLLHNVYIRNIDTKEVIECKSLAEAVRRIGRSRINAIHTPLRKGFVWKGKNGRFEISYKNNDWAYIDKEPSGYTDRVIITVTDKKTGEKRVYHNSIDFRLKELNRKGGLSMAKAIKKLKELNPDLKVEYVNNKTNTRVIAHHIETDKAYKFRTHKELGKFIGVGKSTVQKYIKKCDGTTINGYLIYEE